MSRHLITRITVIILWASVLIASPSREIRGLWLTTYSGLDWPHSTNPAEQRREFITLVESLQTAGINTIFLQVRMRGNAIYPNPYEPFAAEFSGELGRDPGWDPLAFAIKVAHQHGLELHAWFNVYKAWSTKELPPPSDPPHLLRQHPDWQAVGADSAQVAVRGLFFSPGVPGVKRHLLRQIEYLLRHYELDGLHFDYIRYPASSYSIDSISLDRYQAAPVPLTKRQWQRAQIDSFLAAASRLARSLRPNIQLSAAVIGSYQRGWVRSWNAYYHTCQDVRTWLVNDWLDFVVPMIYWRTGADSKIPFDQQLWIWTHEVADPQRIAAGIALYKFAADPAELTTQIALTRELQTKGFVLFRAAFLEPSRHSQILLKASLPVGFAISQPVCRLHTPQGPVTPILYPLKRAITFTLPGIESN